MELTFPSLVPNPLTGVLEVKSVPVQRGFPFANSAWYVGTGQQIETLEELFALMQPNDIAFLAPQRFPENNLVIPASLSGITLIGYGYDLGGRGAAFIEPLGVNDEGLSIEANDVSLINVGVAGKGTADYALQIADDVARFRAHRCKLEGPDGTVVNLIGCADLLFDDCEFCWGGRGIVGVGGLASFPTQIRVRNSLFHNLTEVHVSDGIGSFSNLELTDNKHDNAEDGTAPTDYLLIDHANSTGIVSGCRFATATNAATVLTIAAGIRWAANATEAGWSTARPA